jgi:AraC-like DNA-binding protein
MKTYTYATNALHEFMQQLSFDLKVPLINNKVDLPETIGSGTVKSIFLEEDCCLRFYHVFLYEDILYKWFADTQSDQPMFKLVFSLASNRDCTPVPLPRVKGNSACISENSAMLYSTDFSRHAIVPHGRWINRLVMIFSKRWLETNFTEASELVSLLLDQLQSRYQPSVITQLINREQHELASRLSMEMSQDHFPLLHARTMSLQLINSFLDRIMSHRVTPQQLPIDPQMAAVEKKISEYYDKQMPNIAELASLFNMSSATLKRHFKTVYQKSIYQYYLEKKMAVGKDLICVDHKSVSEVAYTLGYNKINCFSRVFKKYYGVLPSEMSLLRSIA